MLYCRVLPCCSELAPGSLLAVLALVSAEITYYLESPHLHIPWTSPEAACRTGWCWEVIRCQHSAAKMPQCPHPRLRNQHVLQEVLQRCHQRHRGTLMSRRHPCVSMSCVTARLIMSITTSQ